MQNTNVSGNTIYVLGSSGGPFDGSTQCFLIETKNNKQTDNKDLISKHPYSYFMIDGGAGLSQMSKLFIESSQNNEKEDYISQLYSQNCVASSSFSGNDSRDEFTAKSLKADSKRKVPFIEGKNAILQTIKLYSLINKVFITHSHLDHISGMILNLPVVFEKICENTCKTIYGGKTCIDSINENIFNCKIWPNLLYLEGENKDNSSNLINLKQMDSHETININENISVLRMSLLHGKTIQNTGLSVESSCYFVIDKKSKTFFLTFGDCEWEQENFPKVWLECVRLIKKGFVLTTLIIECSNTDKDYEEDLYGHMNPKYLTEALKDFYEIIPEKNKIKDQVINVAISHIKQQIGLEDPRKVILKQLNYRLDQNDLSHFYKVSILISGYSYTV